MAATIDPALLAAWQASEYRVETPRGRIVLRIGEANPALAELLAAAGAQAAAYITADNPRSRLVPAARNAAARERLRQWLDEHGWPWFPGLGIDPRGSRPGEASFLVPGMPEAEALALAADFGQDGIVMIGADAVPRIVLTTVPSADERGWSRSPQARGTTLGA